MGAMAARGSGLACAAQRNHSSDPVCTACERERASLRRTSCDGSPPRAVYATMCNFEVQHIKSYGHVGGKSYSA